MKQFNNWLAQKITGFVGTMACAYVFALIALISLPAAIHSHNLLVIIGWIAQTFLQLVLLSVIMVGQNINTNKQDTLIASHRKLHEKHQQILDILKERL